MRRGHEVALARAFLVASCLVWMVALRPWNWYMGDLVVYRAGGSAVLHGRDLYSILASRHQLHFTYPPLAALAFVPLSVVPLSVAKGLLTFVSTAAIVTSMWLVARLVGELRRPLPEWVLPAALVLPFVGGMVFWPPHTDHLELMDAWWQQLLSATYVIAGVALVASFVRASRAPHGARAAGDS